jgi:pilus assembly protein Flp/PilA
MRLSQSWTRTAWRLLADDSGQGLVEYAVILASIAIVAFAALQFLGKNNNNSLNNSAHAMPG